MLVPVPVLVPPVVVPVPDVQPGDDDPGGGGLKRPRRLVGIGSESGSVTNVGFGFFGGFNGMGWSVFSLVSTPTTIFRLGLVFVGNGRVGGLTGTRISTFSLA